MIVSISTARVEDVLFMRNVLIPAEITPWLDQVQVTVPTSKNNFELSKFTAHSFKT